MKGTNIMDENEKKETNETLKADANETSKTDEAKETSKTDVKEQPKKETTVVTAKDKFAFYSFIFFLIAIASLIVVTVVPKISDAIEDYKIHEEVANEDYDYDTSSSSDDDTSSSSSTVDDSDWDYSALENDPSNYISIDDYDYESQNCYDQALDYLNLIGYSRNGLIKQLQSDGYTNQAINNALYVLEKGEYVTWKSQAVKKAQQYMETFSFSQQRLYEQLISDGFTQEEANYGVSYVYNNN
jgi:hypothetical protein